MSFSALRVLIVSPKPSVLKQNVISPILPVMNSSHCIIHMSETQRITVINYTRKFHADLILCQLSLPYSMSFSAMPALAQAWRIQLKHTLLLLWHQQYHSLVSRWTKYSVNWNKYVLRVSNTPWMAMEPTGPYRRPDPALPTGRWAVMIYTLLNKQPHYMLDGLVELLGTVHRRKQRQTFYRFWAHVRRVLQLHPNDSAVHGLRVTLKGKINRAGSARKQKLIWSIGTTRRADFSFKMLVLQRQVCTPTGTLGLLFHVSYKVDCKRNTL